MFDITAIGEALIDLTQTGLSASGVAEYAANPGGAPANLAVAAAKLGASTAFIGRVGTDAFGTQLRECLRANGVDVSRMLTDAQRPTTLAVVSLDSRGERSFSFYRQHSADLALSPDDVPDEALRRTHISSVLETMLQHPGISLSGLPGHQSSIPVYEPEYLGNETDQQCSATVCQTTSCCPLDCKLRSSPASQTGGYGKRLSLQVHEHLSLYGSMENNL